MHLEPYCNYAHGAFITLKYKFDVSDVTLWRILPKQTFVYIKKVFVSHFVSEKRLRPSIGVTLRNHMWTRLLPVCFSLARQELLLDKSGRLKFSGKRTSWLLLRLAAAGLLFKLFTYLVHSLLLRGVDITLDCRAKGHGIESCTVLKWQPG